MIKSALDIDLYKLTMLQFIRSKFNNRQPQTEWEVKNRTKNVNSRYNDAASSADFLDLVSNVPSITQDELGYLVTTGLFSEKFLKTLHNNPKQVGVGVKNQREISVFGSWSDTTLYEIYVLAILNELVSVNPCPIAEADDWEAASNVLRKKLLILQKNNIQFTDYGTRRRHSYLWHEHAIEMAKEYGVINGTSNVHMARKYGLTPVGSMAHELPMAFAAMAWNKANNFEAVRDTQYDVFKLWNEYYPNIDCLLPDTFGTTQFLKNAPDWVADWSSFRPDSKNPIEAGEEYIEWLISRGRDPKEKTIIFSDGLDVEIDDLPLNGSDIVTIENHFKGRIKTKYGWGTNFTNDFRICGKKAMSIVCKIKSVDNVPAVKLSDNYEKAIGSRNFIEGYREVFGTEGVKNVPVSV